MGKAGHHHVTTASIASLLCINCVSSDDMQYKETNEVDPYVRLSLFDPTSGGTEAFRSTTQMNDASPRCTLHPHRQVSSTACKILVVQEPGLGTLHGVAVRCSWQL